MKKVILLALSVSLLFCTQVYAQSKDNSISLKIGGHIYPGSDVMDFWQLDAADYNGLAFELSYERMLTTNIGIEIPIGYNQAHSDYSNSFSAGDTSDITVENLYVAPSLKFHIPLNQVFEAYIGGGFDIYQTKIKVDYASPSLSINESDTLDSLGYHGLAGIDWFFDNGNTGTPVSIFAEYKYTSLTVDKADDKAINLLTPSGPKHDLEVGGSHFFTGMRWHF